MGCAEVALPFVGGLGAITSTENCSLSTERTVVWPELENVTVLEQITFKRSLCTHSLGVGEYVYEGIYGYRNNIITNASSSFLYLSISQATPTQLHLIPYVLAEIVLSACVTFLSWLPKNTKRTVANE